MSQEDPGKSAYDDLQGEFDYNKTPMAVLGTKVLAFVDPDKRAAWQAHGVDAFVVGRSPERTSYTLGTARCQQSAS